MPMQPRLRAATLSGYLDLARTLDLDPAALTAAVGLSADDLDGSDRWIPAAPVARLLELSARQSGAEDFALRLAGYRHLGTLGPLSAVLRDEPDLRSALALLVRYVRVYNEALHLQLSEDDGVVTVGAWLEFGEPTPTGQGTDLVMAALLGVVRLLVGEAWAPRATSLTHPPPDDAEPYRRLFRTTVRFGADLNWLAFHVHDLDLPVTTSDASIRPYTQELLRTVIAPNASTTTALVAEALEDLLPFGKASAEQVSRRLGLPPRQVQRALAEEGETFSNVVHEVRATLAERYLSRDATSLTEVSQRLGFAAPSAFSRWFRQQFGTTPSEWRRSAAGDSPVVPSPRTRETSGDRSRPS
jgi:AraC-like DNA-binding protein